MNYKTKYREMTFSYRSPDTWKVFFVITLVQVTAFTLLKIYGDPFIPFFVATITSSVGFSNINRTRNIQSYTVILSTISFAVGLGVLYSTLILLLIIPYSIVGILLNRRQEDEDSIIWGLWHHSEDQLFIKDMNGVYTKVNASLLNFFNLDRKDIIGKKDEEIFDSESAKKYIESDRELIETNKPKVFVYPEIKEGKIHYIQTIKQILRDKNGRPIGILGIGRDMTEYYELFYEERRVNNLLNSLLDHASDPIFVKNTNSIYTLVNKAFARIHNVEPSDIIGKNDFDLYDPETAMKFIERDRMIIETKKIGSYENKTMVDGEAVYSLTSKGPIFDEKGNVTGIIGIAHNITDMKKYQSQLMEAQKMESIGILSSGIAHDLNNILTSITGYISLIEEIINDTSIQEMITSIKISTDRATALLKRLQLFTMRQTEDIVPIPVNEVIKDMVQITSSGTLGRTNFVLELCNESPVIYGEPTAIQQVILNILVNAIESMQDDREGTVWIKSSYEKIDNIESFVLKAKDAVVGEYVKISIKDEGTGIDETIINKIFDPFFTSKGKGSQKGTGLGLSIVYGVIMSHRGLLGLKSSEKGTEFSIYFPKMPDKEQIIDVTPLLKKGSGAVLVVEDETETRKFLKASLEFLGLSPIICENGEEAIERFKIMHEEILPEENCMIILDYILPGMKGDAVFRKMKSMCGKCRFIISSGYLETGVLDKLYQEGIHAFLPKPFNIMDLSNALFSGRKNE